MTRKKDHTRMLSPLELTDIRARENREGSPYSDRDMLLDHIDLLTEDTQRLLRAATQVVDEARARTPSKKGIPVHLLNLSFAVHMMKDA